MRLGEKGEYRTYVFDTQRIILLDINNRSTVDARGAGGDYIACGFGFGGGGDGGVGAWHAPFEDPLDFAVVGCGEDGFRWVAAGCGGGGLGGIGGVCEGVGGGEGGGRRGGRGGFGGFGFGFFFFGFPAAAAAFGGFGFGFVCGRCWGFGGFGVCYDGGGVSGGFGLAGGYGCGDGCWEADFFEAGFDFGFGAGGEGSGDFGEGFTAAFEVEDCDVFGCGPWGWWGWFRGGRC